MHRGPKFRKVLPDKTTVILSLGRKTLVFKKKTVLLAVDLMNDDSCKHRSADFLTGANLGEKSPLAVALKQWM